MINVALSSCPHIKLFLICVEISGAGMSREAGIARIATHLRAYTKQLPLILVVNCKLTYGSILCALLSLVKVWGFLQNR